MATKGIDIKTKKACLLDTSPVASDDEEKKTSKRRVSISADNTQMSPSSTTSSTNWSLQRIIVSERQQMAILKQLTASEDQQAQSPKSTSPALTSASTAISKSRSSRISKRNEHGETILHVLARKGEVKQLRKVIKAGGNVNEADYAGWTPLHEAVNKNQFATARLLLKSGALVNAFGPEATTPLHDAVLNNNTKLVELLLNYSANPNQGDLKQITPFDLGASNDMMLKILRRELVIDRQDDSQDEDDENDELGPLSPLSSFECEQDIATTAILSLSPNATTSVDSSEKQRHLLIEDKLRTKLVERLKFKRIDRTIIKENIDKDFSDDDTLDNSPDHATNSIYRRNRNKSSESSSSHGRQINHEMLLDNADVQEQTGDTRPIAREQRNPYDFDSEEEEGEIHDDIGDDPKNSSTITHNNTTLPSYEQVSRPAYHYPSNSVNTRTASSQCQNNHQRSPPQTYSSLYDSSHCQQTPSPSSQCYRDEQHEYAKTTWRHDNSEKKDRSSKSAQDSNDRNRSNSSSSLHEKQTHETTSKNARLLKLSSSSSSNDELRIKIVSKRKKEAISPSQLEITKEKYSISDDEKLLKQQKKIFSSPDRYNKKFEESPMKKSDEISIDATVIKPKIPVLKIVMPTSQHHSNEKKIRNIQQMLPYVLKPDNSESSPLSLEDTTTGEPIKEDTIQTTTDTTTTTTTVIEDDTCALVIDTSSSKDTTTINEETNAETLFETPSSCSSSSSTVVTVMKRSFEDVDNESEELSPLKRQILEPLNTDVPKIMAVVPSLSPPTDGDVSTTLLTETNQSIITTTTTTTTVTEIISTTTLTQEEQQPQLEQEPENTATTMPQQVSHRREMKCTRTLRSHARKQTLSSIMTTNDINKRTRKDNERQQRRKIEKQPQNQAITNSDTIQTSENNLTNNQFGPPSNNNDENQNSSNNSSDDMMSNDTADKAKSLNDDGSSCSSGDGTNKLNDFDTLPPNKRKLRERSNATQSTLTSSSSSNNLITPTATNTQSSSTSSSTNSSSSGTAGTLSPNNVTRELPVNCIKKFLEIRRQIDKRHELMMHNSMVPKTPKDFNEFSMVKKNYLTSSSTLTPEDLCIEKCPPPNDLDKQLTELFIRQEDERYRMRLRHQVERDKLILSHEQDILRLYGNATRSSINQDIPFSYCALLKDSEVYNFPSSLQTDKERLTDSDGKPLNNETAKRKHRWNGRFFIKTIDDSNFKYKRFSQDLNQRQRIEAETLYAMQRRVWLKHLSKDPSRTTNNDIFIPSVEIKENFWTPWQKSQL